MPLFFMLEKFESYLVAEKRFSSHTVTAYLKDVHQFLDAIGVNGMSNKIFGSTISTKGSEDRALFFLSFLIVACIVQIQRLIRARRQRV